MAKQPFRMSKHDLKKSARSTTSVNSVGGHLTVAAVAVSRWIEQARTARYRTIQIQVDAHIISAADPLPRDLRDALDRIHGDSTADTGRVGSPAILAGDSYAGSVITSAGTEDRVAGRKSDRNGVVRSLGGDERSHGCRPNASSTQRATAHQFIAGGWL